MIFGRIHLASFIVSMLLAINTPVFVGFLGEVCRKSSDGTTSAEESDFYQEGLVRYFLSEEQTFKIATTNENLKIP